MDFWLERWVPTSKARKPLCKKGVSSFVSGWLEKKESWKTLGRQKKSKLTLEGLLIEKGLGKKEADPNQKVRPTQRREETSQEKF